MVDDQPGYSKAAGRGLDLLVGDPHQVHRGNLDLSRGLVQRPRHDQLDGAGPGGEAPRPRLDEVHSLDGELLGRDSIENVGLEKLLLFCSEAEKCALSCVNPEAARELVLESNLNLKCHQLIPI